MNRKYQTSLLQPDIFGRQDEKEFLLKKLLGDDDDEPKVNQYNFSIVPIVGVGGIDEFDSFNISKIIFEATTTEEKKGREFKDLNLLQEALRDQLSGKRILLVLDDVWSENIEDWETLVPPFHAVAPGSKISITTRKKQLLQQLGNDNPYHLHKAITRRFGK
uniref:putative disease resistance RPP13-like protein 1 n=1 Tax=Erigeron canadensis TaxID=72917 RepID=UPI001CB91AB7|nr:putative disease resistance RPP13-like protein 1 [Erigeron canadensis]